MRNGNTIKQIMSKKNVLVLFAILVLIIIISVGGWYLFSKSNEGGGCNSIKKCAVGLSCTNKICTSNINGIAGSSCSTKTDCKTGQCVNKKCSAGKVGDYCRNYTDCASNLSCKSNACAVLPDSSAFFNKVDISKTDNNRIRVDFVGVKASTKGPFYFELARQDNREIALTTKHLPETALSGTDTNISIDLTRIDAGDYYLNIYLNNEMIYAAPVKK